jgi:dienelactone hydrolase
MNTRVLPTLLAALALAGPVAAADSPFDYAKAPVDLGDTSVTLRDVSYTDATGRAAEATVVGPRTPGKHPAVLFVHWYEPHDPSSGRTQFVPDAMRLARKGVVSLLVDTLWSDPQWFGTRDVAQDLPHSIEQVKNLRRALDVLAAMPEVDPKRLHYVGHDFGAMYGALLASVDRRPQSWVFIAGTKAWADWFLLGRKPDPETKRRVEETFRAYDPERTVGSMAPSPVLFQFGNKDPYVPREAADALVAGARDPKDARFYECGHGMNMAAMEERVAWLLKVIEGTPVAASGGS